MKAEHLHGPAMTLGNMRQLGVQRLLASCLNDACRHTALVRMAATLIRTVTEKCRRPGLRFHPSGICHLPKAELRE
jgi:hypothetical protein